MNGIGNMTVEEKLLNAWATSWTDYLDYCAFKIAMSFAQPVKMPSYFMSESFNIKSFELKNRLEQPKDNKTRVKDLVEFSRI